MAATSFLSASVCILALCNGVLHRPSQASPVKAATSAYSGSHLYGTLADYPGRPVLRATNTTANKDLDVVFDGLRQFVATVPGSHSDDTDYGFNSEVLGNKNPACDDAALLVSQNCISNQLADAILFFLAGGNQPQGRGKESLNRNNSNVAVTDAGGNSAGFVDHFADHFLRRLGGKGFGPNKKQSRD